MVIQVRSPTERAEEGEEWEIDVDQFGEGPDTWNTSERTGWKWYLVETLPDRDIYALTKYSWRNNRQEKLVDIGTINVSANLDRDSLNESLESNGIETLAQKQYNTLLDAYESCIWETIQNCTLDKGFEVCDDTVYITVSDYKEYLQKKIEDIIDRKESVLEDVDVGDSSTYPSYYSEDEIEKYASYEDLFDEQLDNLNLVSESVERPHEDGVEYAQYCQFVGTYNFNTLDPYKLRAIELVHNGVYYNKPAVAIVQALREEGLSQKEIANKLDKDKSTISKQVSVAKNLTERSRWHSTNVTMDGRG